VTGETIPHFSHYFGVNLQSHALSQTYGAILPTSLTYIDLLARGFSPWRPAAVIGTSYYGIIFDYQSFSFFSFF